MKSCKTLKNLDIFENTKSNFHCRKGKIYDIVCREIFKERAQRRKVAKLTKSGTIMLRSKPRLRHSRRGSLLLPLTYFPKKIPMNYGPKKYRTIFLSKNLNTSREILSSKLIKKSLKKNLHFNRKLKLYSEQVQSRLK